MMSVRWLGAVSRGVAFAWLVGLGVAQLLSQILIVPACRYASAEQVAPFIYTVIVFTALLEWLIWDHPPTLFTYLGMALVIGGGLVAVRATATTRRPRVANNLLLNQQNNPLPRDGL